MGVESDIREVLKEIEDHIGRENLRKIIDRIMNDLSSHNPRLKDIGIPEDPCCIDLSMLGEEEKRAFFYMLMDIGGSIAGDKVRYSFLKRYNTPK